MDTAARWLLLAAAAALPFQEIGPGVRPFESLLGLAVLAGVPGLVRCWREWGRARAVDREVLAVVGLGLVALLVNWGPGESLRSFRLVILEPALFYFLLTRVSVGPLSVVSALLVGAIATALLGFAQLATGVGPIEAEGVDRIRGLYRSPNNLALYLDRVLPIAAALAIAGLRSPRAYVLTAMVVVLGAAMVLTYSVGGWLASGIAVAAVVGLLAGRRGLAVLVVAGLVAGGALMATRPERVLTHLDLTSDSTSGVRVILWRSAVEMLRDHPLFGVGLDNFVYHYNPARGGDYMDPAAWREPDLSHPHNVLLDWWLSLGVVGALLLARLIVVGYRLARTAWSASADDPRGRALTAGLIGTMLSTLVHGSIDNSFFLPDLAALWWASYALLWRLAEVGRSGRAP